MMELNPKNILLSSNLYLLLTKVNFSTINQLEVGLTIDCLFINMIIRVIFNKYI